MPITDLTGYTWVGNDTLDDSDTIDYSLNFISNSNNFNRFNFESGGIFIGYLNYNATPVYSTYDGWVDEAYKTIQITGGNDVTNSTLIAWLEANGTLTPPAPTPSGPVLKIYSNDGRETSYDIYVDGTFKVNVPRTFTITTNVSRGSYSGATSINVGGTATVTLSSDSPYSLPETITVTNASYTYNSSTGVVVLSNPTGNVTITCECIMHSGGMDG